MNSIYLYGTIGEDWWDENAVSAGEFVKQLNAFNGEPVHIFVNSSGGSAFDGSAIYSAITRYTGKVTAHIDGLAASAASFCILSADEVIVSPSAMMMIHNAWTYAAGNAIELREMADSLEKLDETITGIYTRKTGMSAEEVAAMMRVETWMTAEEAIEMGFADTMGDAANVSANVNARMFAMFKNPPDFAKNAAPEPAASVEEPASSNAGETISEQTMKAEGEAPDGSTGAGWVVVNGRIYPKKGKKDA